MTSHTMRSIVPGFVLLASALASPAFADVALPNPPPVRASIAPAGLTNVRRADLGSGWIDVRAVSYALTSPRDPQSGLPSGQRLHRSIVIGFARSFAALGLPAAPGALLPAVRVEFDGKTLTLTGARVLGHSDVAGGSDVTFTYQEIQWTWVRGGVTASDDWVPAGH